MGVQFATVADLRAAWPSAEALDEGRATALLPLVSAVIAGVCDAGAVDEDVLRLVTCQVTARMLTSSANGLGVTQDSWGASPYSGSVTYANPSGDVYLTAFEKRLLGVDADWSGYVMPKVPE